MEILALNPFVVWKLSLFSGMQNYALMHREGLKGFNPIPWNGIYDMYDRLTLQCRDKWLDKPRRMSLRRRLPFRCLHAVPCEGKRCFLSIVELSRASPPPRHLRRNVTAGAMFQLQNRQMRDLGDRLSRG